MKKSLRTTVCCIACTLLAASAWAQREPGSSSSSSSSQGGLGSPSQRSSAYSTSMHGQQSLRVSQQVINAQVKTQDGQQLGQIEDLIANPQTGRIEFAVVSKGDKLCPIPMQLLQPQGGSQGGSSTSTSGTTSGTSSTTSDTTSGTSSTSPFGRSSASAGQRVTFVAQIDKSKIDQAPSFSRSQWPEMSQTWSQQIYSHYGVTPEAAGGTGSSGSSYQHGKSSSGSSLDSSTSGSSKSDSSKSSSDSQKKSNQKSEN